MGKRLSILMMQKVLVSKNTAYKHLTNAAGESIGKFLLEYLHTYNINLRVKILDALKPVNDTNICLIMFCRKEGYRGVSNMIWKNSNLPNPTHWSTTSSNWNPGDIKSVQKCQSCSDCHVAVGVDKMGSIGSS